VRTVIFSLAETNTKQSAVFAIVDNLCINPRVRNLKPYLKYTEAHDLCLDSLLRCGLRTDTEEFV